MKGKPDLRNAFVAASTALISRNGSKDPGNDNGAGKNLQVQFLRSTKTGRKRIPCDVA